MTRPALSRPIGARRAGPNRLANLWFLALLSVACGTPAVTDSGSGTGLDSVGDGSGGQLDGHDAGKKDGTAVQDSDTDLKDALTGDLGSGGETLSDGDSATAETLLDDGDDGGEDASTDASGSCDFPANPAPGEPGASCKTADDCDSAFCVDSPDGKICTQSCVSCCPAGFGCAKMTGVDGAFACMPKQLALCQPCTTDAQCGAVDPGALCLNSGADGNFCGSGCATSGDCPSGYACQDADGQLGAAKQCVRTAGVCNCTKWGALVGASTTCSQVNGQGTCNGTRKCLIAGLSACSAPVPATETCNGVDDNCDGITDPVGSAGCVTYFKDGDGDGFGGGKGSCLCSDPGGDTTVGGDCDDNSTAVHPGAAEICDGLDNNCNGQTDEGFPDTNGDGIADCVATDIDGDGYPNNIDCAPYDPTIHPGATEICDSKDNDCDGITDNPGAGGCTQFFQDLDGDGSGAGAGECLCGVTGAYTTSIGGDCNDSNASIHPGVPEICNGADDNCNGMTDEGCDDDLDLWCDATMTVVGTPAVCPSGKQDCNDTNPAIHPGQPEICGNGIDDNCDGLTDSGTDLVGCTVFYVDADGDGFGDKNQSACLCAATALYTVKVGGDCNDGDPAVNPKATEICNGIDDNCDGITDGASAADCKVFFNDADSDGYGVTGDQKCQCVASGTYTATVGGDCNDAASAIHPGAVEICDGVDNDCDGVTDPANTIDCTAFFKDADGDGYGNYLTGSKCMCAAGNGYVAAGGDCDDANPAVHPNAPEICNGIDDNCDGATDPPNTTGCTNFHLDQDGDGYGQTWSQCLCAASGLYTALNGDDCDDTKASIHPGAVEICDGLDNNCNGLTDEGVQGVYYADADKDGYGTGAGSAQCGPTTAFSATLSGDCDDTNAAVHPLATEICNGIDDNCNGLTDEGVAPGTFYQDADGDGFGNAAVTAAACIAAVGYVANSSDCNDANAAIHPGASEICDGVDNNCDGQTDEGLPTGTWWPDADTDGYGASAGPSISGCELPGYVTSSTDCNDASAAIHPGVAEVCGNGIDDNCNGQTDEGCVTACAATVLDGLNKSGDATLANKASDGGWVWDSAGEWTATQGTSHQYLRWGAISSGCGAGCGYWATSGDSATWSVTVPANATFMAIDYSVDNHYDENGNTVVPDTKMYLQLTFDGAMTQIGPFPTWQGAGWKTLAWPVAAAQQGKTVTMKALLVSPQTSVTYNNVGAALDNVRAISGCSDPSTFCASGGNGGGQGSQTYYKDVDGDGYGDPATAFTACIPPVGAVTIGGDCNDANAAIHPGATEIACNGIDDNCNGVTDEGGVVLNPLDSTSDYQTEPGDWWAGRTYAYTQGAGAEWWGDNAGCGYHKGNDTLTFNITVPSGAAGVAFDVYFDNRHSVSPDTVDATAKIIVTVNGISQQIGPFAAIQNPKWRTLVFPMTAANYGQTYTVSADLITTVANTSYGKGCTGGSAGGFAIDNARSVTTCGTNPPACTPGVTASSWYKDADGDGYGDPNTVISACIEPTGYIAAGGDCNDANAAVHPGATESCNGIDDNCDGVTDGVNSTGCTSFYTDADGDGYGATNATATCLCAATAGKVANKTDCNDANAAINPGAAEICNGIDDNCDGLTDPQDSGGCHSYYADADKDGYGGGTGACLCAANTTYTTLINADCNDNAIAIHPGATEICNGIDDNCNGQTDEGLPTGTWYKDADFDGHGNPAISITGCDLAGYVTSSAADDCNDADASIYPGATEICDGKDNNCNGVTDEGFPTGTWYQDADGDTYGNVNVPFVGCQLAKYVANNGDCDDTNAAVHPGALEVCYDGIDNNCNGQTDENCPACVPTLVNGFNNTSGWTNSSGQWVIGASFTPTEGSKCLYYGGTCGYLSSNSSDKLTVTFTVPQNSPFLTLDYIFDNLSDVGITDMTLKATFTFNGTTQTVGPFNQPQGTTVKQLKWAVPQALWGTSQTLVVVPTSSSNGCLLSGVMIDNLRTTCN